MGWQILSNVFGFAGSMLMVVPDLRHQPLRDIHDLFRRVHVADADARQAVEASAGTLDAHFHRWNRRGYAMVTLGVGLLCVSFFLGLVHSLTNG